MTEVGRARLAVGCTAAVALLILLTVQLQKLLLQRLQSLLVHFAQPRNAVCVELLVNTLADIVITFARDNVVDLGSRRRSSRRCTGKAAVDRLGPKIPLLAR